jgi:hypothetical protein
VNRRVDAICASRLHATDRRPRSVAARRRRRREFVPIGLVDDDDWIGTRPMAAAGDVGSLSAFVGNGASMEASNARPASVICQPSTFRRTNDWLKMSRSGARAAKRFVRLVQLEPLDIRIATAPFRSASEARPPGCPANTFNIVI